jgi:hypothetical protein
MAPAPQEPVTPIQEEASGGRIHHYGVGGVADTTASAGSATATAQKPNSFDALRASQQHYTQALPNAGVVPSTTQQLPSNVGNADNIGVDKLKNPASAYSSYNRLANSGHASLADLQSAYDLYSRAQAPAEPITQVQMGAPAEPKAEVASEILSGGYDKSGVNWGGNAAGGRIQPHHFGSGGGIVNYIGMPTKKSLQEGAESVVGSGTSGGDPTLASIASQDYLPEQAARGGVIHLEHHAGPDETNGYSNVAGKTAGVAAVAPEEGVATGVPRSNIFEGLNSNSRAVKNNNPGNIIDSGFARSQPGYAGTDGRFARFETPEHGESAMHGLLQNYQKQGITTPAGIISKWAPASDNNDTGGYIAQVAKKLGVSPNDPIDVTDPKVRDVLGKTIATVEAGAAGPNAGNAAYNRIEPATGGQQKTQPQMPAGVNQTPTKEGLSGMLGISMTDNQRLAAFNAFARMAGTPGKFGMGLAAAADTYSKTLMEANKQQREGYTAESEAKLRAEEAASKRISQKGLTTSVRSPADESGKFTIENQVTVPGTTTTFGGQGNAGTAGGPSAGGPSAGQAGTENAPQAPITPEQAKEINLMGPRVAGDQSNPFNVLDQLGKEAIKNNAMNDTEARALYQKEFSNAQTAAKVANSARGDLASTVKAVSELPSGGLTGFGPGSESRLALARTINAGLRTFGDAGFDENNITQKQILDKVRTLSANEQGGSAAAKWLENYASAFPNGEQTEQAAKALTAKLLVANTQHLDYARVAQAYGAKSMQMGYDVNNAMERVNPQKLYVAAQDDLTKLMVNNSKVNPNTGKLWNPVSALASGEITPEQFNEFAVRNGSKISNLSRFVLGQ